jgi:hypothetical protein
MFDSSENFSPNEFCRQCARVNEEHAPSIDFSPTVADRSDRHCELRPGVFHIADGLANGPDFQNVVRARLEQGEQFFLGRRLLI